MGERHRCENCSSADLSHQAFASHGVVHSYTVQRFAPPKPNACLHPWVPRPLAWIDLADGGPRIMSPVLCDPDAIDIGSKVSLSCGIGWVDAEAREVVAFQFILTS
nr:OB-fold domain-containing protein [Sphingobium boeckii]